MDSFEFTRHVHAPHTPGDVVSSVSLTDPQLQMVLVALGLQYTVGRFADSIKRQAAQHSQVNRENALEDMGDLLEQIAIVIVAVNSTFDSVMNANVAKRQFRNPKFFKELLPIVKMCQTEHELMKRCLELR